MIVKLNEEQRQAIAVSRDQVRLVDDESQTTYVLVREDVFDRIKGILEDGEADIRSAYPLMDAVAAREGWDDPELDSYH